ncbi:hypothetical protein [Candidatus Coxiella mudrowiae]|uniref:hypothetical protein n=1 Tax=Candidatus Coxiella mudrowiae TaxID=2054173 RepID=UPI001561EA1C|nr:hypothetical protein [Candidatus Coxiella mudrowiae]
MSADQDEELFSLGACNRAKSFVKNCQAVFLLQWLLPEAVSPMLLNQGTDSHHI